MTMRYNSNTIPNSTHFHQKILTTNQSLWE